MKLTAAELAHKERVRRWVEVRPKSKRMPAGRPDKHPGKGNRNRWKEMR
jgi:hypothetical protein